MTSNRHISQCNLLKQIERQKVLDITGNSDKISMIHSFSILPVQVCVAKSGYFPLTALQASSLKQVDVNKYLP